MAKLSLEEIKSALDSAKIDQPKQIEVLNHLSQVIKELEEEKAESKLPKKKTELGVVLFDSNNELAGKEFTACVVKLNEGDDHSTVLTRLSTAARAQNNAAKRKKNPITTMGECIGYLKRKFAKEVNVNIQNKIPCRVLISNNQLI